jgi:glycosyltransferase involved in cell wall biosynthesis
MKIGILGSRGVPNQYGGFEQFAQHLSEGLIQKGHEVWVYNSDKHYFKESNWKGIHIIHCLDLENSLGTAGQFVYDFNCVMDARKRKFDILLHLGYTSDSIWHKFWPSDTINLVNMDGLEWKRSKYSRPVQHFLKLAEKLAATHADYLVADSLGIQEYLLKKHNKDSIYIPYGAAIFKNPNSDLLSNWGLLPKKYLLLIARMEPENNIEMIINGYLQSNHEHPLVLVGKTDNRFGKYLKQKYASTNILFPGGIYDSETVDNLRHFSALYFHGHSVGEQTISLEAMACGCTIAAHANQFNKAILGENAFYFTSSSEIQVIIDVLYKDQETLATQIQHNLENIRSLYNWSTIISQYEEVFRASLEQKGIRQMQPSLSKHKH